MTDVALWGEVSRSSRRGSSEEPVEFGTGLRARLESVGAIGSGDAGTLRRALERKLLAVLPGLAGVQGGSASRLRVPRIPLATLAYQANLVPAGPLEEALAEAERRGEPVGRVLTRTGLLSERDVERLLAEQRGFPYVRVRDVDLDERVSELLPERTAALFAAVPLGYVGGALVVAVADSTDDVAMESITAEVGEPVAFVAAPRDDVGIALRRLYGAEELAA